MPQSMTIENNFSAGLKTDFNALNFPPHAAIDADNCIFTIQGDTTRRLGFDYETSSLGLSVNRSGKSLSSYIWNNAGGDGATSLYVQQIGSTIYFYEASAATVATPLSVKILAGTVDISTYLVSGSSYDSATAECQYADGNGNLFIFNPYCDPIYVTYDAGTLTANVVDVQIRDFTGLAETVAYNYRPSTLSAEHQYNLINQGWVAANPWTATSTTSTTIGTGVKTFTIATGVTGISVGQSVKVQLVDTYGNISTSKYMLGTVSSYTSGTGALVLSITSVVGSGTYPTAFFVNWIFTPTTGYITTWFTSVGNYPSNADQWWSFKNTSNAFDPTVQANVTSGTGPAPKGNIILDAFNQQRALQSGVVGITDITTMLRPRTGCWFQGRVWYTGVDDTQAATGDASRYTWSENIYFSQIVTTPSDFGKCYQTNDPTAEDLFDLLPTDGGTIRIQGSGPVYKLFPIQNGMLVFAFNGIWFITGSQGIGFTANDYTITKISSVQALSDTSFVNVNGLPMFWNQEAIYYVQPAQQGLGLTVENMIIGNINRFYDDIPKLSKQYCRGSYDPLNYTVQWVYRSTAETSVTDRYQYDKMLTFNVYTKAFYPYTISTGTNMPYVHDVKYVDNPGGNDQYPPQFKYFASYYNGSTYVHSFAEEKDTTYVDWSSHGGLDYESYYITGYSIKGGAVQGFQPIYVYIFSNLTEAFAYKIRGIWDFATEANTGRVSNIQTIYNNLIRYGTMYRKHKIRGHGLALQIKVSSVTGMPFDIVGWTIPEAIEAGIS